MAVSQKVKPKTVDLSASLSMLESTKTDITATDEKPTSIHKIETGAPLEKKSEPVSIVTTKDTQIIFRTTETNKNSLKGFFATYGFTLSKGIQLACFYLEQEIKAGNITMGPAGILKKEK